MAGWLHGVCVGTCWVVSPQGGFSLSLFCNYSYRPHATNSLPVLDKQMHQTMSNSLMETHASTSRTTLCSPWLSLDRVSFLYRDRKRKDMEGTGSFVFSSGARVLLATPRTRFLLSCSYGPMVWRCGNVVGLITCWINRCTRQCYRCVQHLYVLPTIHHRSRSWHQCQAHACGMHDSHASHNM